MLCKKVLYSLGWPLLFASLCVLAGCTDDGLETTDQVCDDEGGTMEVARPEFRMNLSLNTGWFSSPIVVDLDGDGQREIVGPFYDVGVWDADGNLIDQIAREGIYEGRVYAPAVVSDLDGDGTMELVIAAGEGGVVAFEWIDSRFEVKSGWPASTCIAGSCFEVRSIAADDIDGDGNVEVVVSDTRSESPEGYESTNPHVFVFEPDGSIRAGWPRYDTRTGVGRDLEEGEDGNCYGHSGYGSYGLNVSIGDVDDDADKEIQVTYDNHHIQVFNTDGTTVLTDPSYFTRRGDPCEGSPMSYGQFIRYLDPEVEHNHYHLHEGDWPGPSWTMWLQWTHSPPSIGDINQDGMNEIVGVPNVEMDEPYHTYHYAVMVLEGDYDANDHRAGRRLPGWEELPLTEHPLPNDDWYPPAAPPSPALVNIDGDSGLEIIVPGPDGYMYAFTPDARLLWRYDYAKGHPLVWASEAAVADLSGDGRLEIIFGTFGSLVILTAAGQNLHTIDLPDQNPDSGNGVGAAATPTVADIDGDGDLEILLLTIDHGIDVFEVPNSACNCIPDGADPDLYCGPWTTARGNYLRNGRAPGS